MRKLKDILSNINIEDYSGNMDIPVHEIQFDSRKVEENDLFVATKGLHVDGHDFIEKAIELGATTVVHEDNVKDMSDVITYIKVNDSKRALGWLASNFYGNPSQKLKLVGITGTNGKTTCATLLHSLFVDLGYTVGLLSTIENKINDEVIPAHYTTPDPVELNKLISQMVKQGCTHCFMEVSSHAIDQKRIEGLDFDGAVFTNISHDHLDYHKTFDEYISVKKRFFDGLRKSAFALTNIDDKRGMVMLQNCKADKYSYSLKKIADFRVKVLTNSFEGLELDFDGTPVWFNLIGEFNAYNLLAIYASAILLEEEKEIVLSSLSALNSANGRFDFFRNKGITAIVDYAHTPDALENVLKTISTIRNGNEQVITVIGCGGDRDKEKRPKMANIAAKYSNRVILTSDNPRSEDPDQIIEDMKKGLSPTQDKNTLSITDRKEAIKMAVMLGNEGDIVLVAGKGHETYQEINGVRNHFDDKEILKQFLID